MPRETGGESCKSCKRLLTSRTDLCGVEKRCRMDSRRPDVALESGAYDIDVEVSALCWHKQLL